MPITLENETTKTVVHYKESNTISLSAFSSVLNVTVNGPIFMDRFSTANRCIFGGYVGVGCFTYVRNASIGRYVHIGSRVSIGGFNHPTDWLSVGSFQYQDPNIPWPSTKHKNFITREFIPANEGVIIESDVWVGDNSTVLSGVKLDFGTIVGAGSVVTKNTEPFTIVVGNPAKIIKRRFNLELQAKILQSQWWNRNLYELSGLPFNDPMSVLNEIARSRRVRPER